jgi:hypothetical protein
MLVRSFGRCFVAASLSLAFAAGSLVAGPAYTDQKSAGEDYQYVGEYVGTIESEGQQQKIGVQVQALGNGKFLGVGYIGGLPGEGWNREEVRRVEGKKTDEGVVFELEGVRSVVKDNVISVYLVDGNKRVAEIQKVVRQSPTLEAKPPEGAVVLFDGKNVDHFPGAKMTDDGLLIAGATSADKFGSANVHVEFLLPFMPEDSGQARGNSGLYLQGRWEVQMLDSFALSGEDNECGGIYKIGKPAVNMCYPPLTWQTYDVEFHAAKFDGDKVVEQPWMTVKHNGVVIHDKLKLPAGASTTAAPVGPGPEPGPVYLQDHGNPVRYRNIWVQPIEE